MRISFSFMVIFQLLACGHSTVSPQMESNLTAIASLKDIDGPYIYTYNDTLQAITVEESTDSTYYIRDKKILRSEITRLTSIVSNNEKDSFDFQLLSAYLIPPDKYMEDQKVLVTSDIEGNFNAFYSMLIGTGVIDSDYNWTFDSGHLVVCGDMFDRGDNVIPALWLLYKLEGEAPKYGGHVHFILGNHDIMQLQLDTRYIHPKYIALAKAISGLSDEQEAYKYLMSEENELIKWVRSKNAIERIGNNLYLHGGISPDLVDADLSIQEINEITRENIDQLLQRHPGPNENANLIFGRTGPFWYRGLVKDYKDYYEKLTESEIDQILAHYDLERIIIGHTIVDDHITSDYNGKVVRVDIKHDTEKFTGKHEALLIQNDEYYIVNDLGEKRPLE